MERKAGLLPNEPNVPSPEINRLSPSEIQDLITKKHIGLSKGPKTSTEHILKTKDFFKQYEKSDEGSQTIEKLIEKSKDLTIGNIYMYFTTGLSTDIAVSQKIPELSDYQPEEIAQAFTLHFSSVVESLTRVFGEEKIPSKLAIQLLIEHPNCLEPNFYELYYKQIKHNGYFNKSNILQALRKSPNNAKEKLENNNKTFESIISTLTIPNSTRRIKYAAIRHLVNTKRENAINLIKKNPDSFYLKLDQKGGNTKLYKEIERLKDKADLISAFEKLLEKKIGPLNKRIDWLEQQNKKLFKALSLGKIAPISASIETRPRQISPPIIVSQPAPVLSPPTETSIQSAPKTHSDRTNLDPQQPTEQTQEENDSGISRSRNHPNLPLVTQIESSLKQKYQDLHHPLLTDIVINKFLNKYSQPEVEIEKAISIYESLVEKFKEKIKKNNTILLAITEACLSNEDDSVSFVSRYIDRFDSFIKNEKYSNIIRSIIASTTISLITKEITLEEAISKLNYESTQW